MDLEPVNHWPDDAPDFDEKQRQLIIDVSPPLMGGLSGQRIEHKGKVFITKSVILSNVERPDGIEAFVQAELVK
jgi:uncharacterized protein (DUF779 family)